MDAFSPEIITILETLIAPGKQVRISPFVEAMQFSMLFGEIPATHARYESAQGILQRHQQKIDELADVWTQFNNDGKQFSASRYDNTFLDAYLVYYLTVNVGKLQLLFLDLLRRRVVPSRFSLLDIGTASGTTFIAFLDFLTAWENVCHLHNVAFPIESVSFCAIDARQECLDYSRTVIV